jgi:hypothetical protein
MSVALIKTCRALSNFWHSSINSSSTYRASSYLMSMNSRTVALTASCCSLSIPCFLGGSEGRSKPEQTQGADTVLEATERPTRFPCPDAVNTDYEEVTFRRSSGGTSGHGKPFSRCRSLFAAYNLAARRTPCFDIESPAKSYTPGWPHQPAGGRNSRFGPRYGIFLTGRLLGRNFK